MENLFKKFLAFGAGNIIVLLLGFISAPLITRIINPDELGKVSMFNTLTNLIVLIILLGLDQAFVRFFYEEDEENRFNLMVKSMKLPIISVMVIGVILYIFSNEVSMMISGKVSVPLTILFIIQCFFSVISRFFILYIRMEQKAKLYSTLQVVGKLTYIIFILIIMNFVRDYNLVILSLVLSNIFVTCIAVLYQRKNLSFTNLKDKSNTSLKELVKFGMPLIITMSITWIMQSIDKVFIKEFSGYTELGIYAGAFSIIALMNVLQGTFTTFWVPVANERFKNNPDDKKFFENVTKGITIIMAITAVGVILSKDIIVFLLGAKYKEAMFIFPFLVFMPVMYTISETTVIGISFMKKTKYTIWIALISAITNIIGNLILVPILGAKGAAISTGFSYIIFFISRTVVSKKLYEVEYGLSKILLIIGSMSILALYASFNRFDMIIVLLVILNIFVICFVYREIIKLGINLVKVKLKK